jgi:DNA-binding CsgD family transcriptional regulator
MRALSASRLRRVLEVSARLAAFDDLASLRIGALEALREVIPYDIASYNEIAPGSTASIVADPTESLDLTMLPLFVELAPQNPLVHHYATTGDTRALRFSDFLTQRQLHRLEIHQLLYRPIGAEHQLATVINPPGTQLVGIALNRSRHDFDGRDVAALELLRPHLYASYRRLAEIAQLGQLLAALEDEAGHEAALLVDDQDTILKTTSAAERLLHLGPADRLPAALASADGRLLFEHNGRLLRARIHRDGPTRAIALSVPEHDALRSAAKVHGLTPRETQVLEHIAAGAATAAVARRLGISTRTAEKHLEHAYRKLEASNRAQALERLRRPV